MSFGQFLFGQYTMTSCIVKFSRQLVQDELVGLLAGVLTDQLGERLGRRVNTALTTGTGTNAPYGLTTSVTNRGKEAASQTAFTKAELIDLQHSVDRAYRGAPNVGFMMNDTILAAARKLDVGNTDTVQIFYPGLAVGEPDRLLGQQIWVNNDLTGTQAQSAKIIYYGDFSKYIIRQIKTISIERNDSLYWNELNVGFMGWLRLDGNLVDGQAIKFLQNKTT
jgi:HK97 family phage major capsid protein